MHHRDVLIGLTAAATAATLPLRPAHALGTQPFDRSWRALTFRRIPPTQYTLSGTRLGILAEQSASVIYRSVEPSAQAATITRWSWSVSESVPPTDLSRRGGDDRNIALYFVFMDAASAARLSPDTSLTRLMANRSARILIYVWGGSHAPGSIVPSPYTRGRGVSVIRRAAGTGSHTESVDLQADHARAFGSRYEALVGLAVSSDSDDTGSVVRAELRDLTLA
jgi:hypothetical protein